VACRLRQQRTVELLARNQAIIRLVIQIVNLFFEGGSRFLSATLAEVTSTPKQSKMIAFIAIWHRFWLAHPESGL
jgi:hypothetical protein